MKAIDVEVTRAEVDALVRELEAERYRHVAGVEPAPALGPDGRVTLHDALLALPRERDRARRLAFGRAVSEASSLPAHEAAVEKRARARAEVGLVPAWEKVVLADALLAAS